MGMVSVGARLVSAREVIETLRQFPPGSTVPVEWVVERLEQEAAVGEVEIDLTLDEVGVLLGVSAETIRAACVRGEFPGSYKRAGREWRVPKAAIAAYQEGEQARHRERELQEAGAYAALGSRRSAGSVPGDKRVPARSGGNGK